MEFLWKLLKFPPPPPAITDEQIETLLNIPSTLYYPPVHFSPFIRSELKRYIQTSWEGRAGKKSLEQITAELVHTCTQEYLTKFFYPPPPILGLNELIEQKKAQIADPAVSGNIKEAHANVISDILKSVAILFTEGYISTFKENLLFSEDGRPIGMREKGGDRSRSPLCHAKLETENTCSMKGGRRGSKGNRQSKKRVNYKRRRQSSRA
jgi:hypothetical protein